MFERSKLFERLRHYYLESARERGKVVLISGGVATGKTEFAYRFAQYARGSGALLLNATASAQDRSVRMGVVGQLFSSADLPPAVAQVAEDVTGLADRTGGAGGRAPADPTEDLLVQRACAALLKLARSGPLVIAVDDVHFADETSVRTLLALQRRIGMARVLLLLNQRDSADRRQARLRAELTRQPYFRLIRLEPLSPEGVKRLIEANLGSPSCPAHLTTEFHRLSGGNPLIVRALIDDHRAGRGRRGRGPVIGGSFEETVLMCLHRHDAGAVRTARAAAVLGPRASAETIARLTGEPGGTVAAALERLEAGGLVQGPQFRHPRARSAVLRDLPADLSAALRLRAAEVLESEHAPLVEIAAHLVQAGSPPPARYVHVLERAAQQECAGGDAEQAVRCLRLALRGRLSDRKEASLTASLARVQWLMNPTGMSEQLDALVAADAAGHLDPVDALMTVRALAWVGRHADAAAVLERAAGRTVPAGAADLRQTVAWLRRRHPNVLSAVTVCLPEIPPGAIVPRPGTGRGGPGGGTGAVAGPGAGLATGADLLGGAGVGGDGGVDGAEHTLQTYRLGSTTPEAVITAIQTLVQAGRLDRAGHWCEALLPEAGPTWRAVLLDAEAGIALARGDLPAAARHARAALAALPGDGWGVAVGSPLAKLVLAATGMGEAAEAASVLRRVLPDAVRSTAYWLEVLHARGRHHAAADRPHAALDDFAAAGRLAIAWGLDHPEVVPWRVELAQVHARTGGLDAACELAREQLELPGGDQPRVRGACLRVLAAAAPIRERLGLLREAAELFQACGDRYELALTYGELARAGEAAGQGERAGMLARHAISLAGECGAVPLRDRLTRRPPERPASLEALSPAERKVAVLATRGLTNREIGRNLHITESTVEQHLTRIYGKLRINRRTDLPAKVPVSLTDPV